MTNLTEESEIDMSINKEMQEEMVGVLTAMSIVSKRLANRLAQLNEKEKGEKEHE